MNASFIGGIIAVVVILLIIAVIKTYNHMVVLRNLIKNHRIKKPCFKCVFCRRIF